MSAQEARVILEPAATRVRDPLSGRSMWLAGMVVDPVLEDGVLQLTLRFEAEHQPADRLQMQEALRANIKGQGFEGPVICNVRIGEGRAPAPAPAQGGAVRGMNAGGGIQPHGGPINKQPVAGVRHVIAVASGKGGVGKSTVATNLAVGLAERGFDVGLMDADIYGPSLPLMMNVQGTPVANAEKKIVPLVSYGVKCMSIGFLAPAKEPIIWRGPMVMGVVRQFLQDVAWAPLDYLIVDLPPGTGDAQLTMIQGTPISGAVIVTTPQEVALIDAVRGVEMFRKLEVPVLGVVENMSWYTLPGGGRVHPFGRDGGVAMAAEYGVPLLGQVPLEDRVREGGDKGAPAVLEGGGEAREVFLRLAQTVAEALPA